MLLLLLLLLCRCHDRVFCRTPGASSSLQTQMTSRCGASTVPRYSTLIVGSSFILLHVIWRPLMGCTHACLVFCSTCCCLFVLVEAEFLQIGFQEQVVLGFEPAVLKKIGWQAGPAFLQHVVSDSCFHRLADTSSKARPWRGGQRLACGTN